MRKGEGYRLSRSALQNKIILSVCDAVCVAFILRLPACRNTSTVAVLQDTTDKQANVIAGKVDGIQFTISGNGVNQTVTTANGGKFQLDNLMPGVYTVTEQSIDKYVPQEVHRVTVVAGQVSKVNFNNVLKRGNLQVIKSSEDNLVEGVTFHLYGTSLSGIAVDEYAVTDKNGVASFDDVLISGTTPYTIEEVDTAIRYVVPANQTAALYGEIGRAHV